MAGTKDDFIDMKWLKKVEDFRSHWIFINIFEDSELFLVTSNPPAKWMTWASDALPEAALNALRPRIQELRHACITGSMVGVDFVTRCIAPLQHHHRPVWSYVPCLCIQNHVPFYCAIRSSWESSSLDWSLLM
jgi:hypothetical protein